MDWNDILKTYNRDTHLKHIESLCTKKIKLSYVFSENWVSDEKTPYIVKTHLLDSYYCLPERPDMAFTFLWKSINSLYNELFLTYNPAKKVADGKSIDFFMEKMLLNFDLEVCSGFSVNDLLSLYIKNIPEKLPRFIAGYILKNYAIESSEITYKNLSTSYLTFKKQFPEIFNDIKITYGDKYRKLTNPEISKNGSIKLNISDKNKSYRIMHSLGDKIKELLIKKEVNIENKNTMESYTLKLNTDKIYLNFIVRNILYSIRNNTIHGKIASRLNSSMVNNDSYSSSSYTYLLGYFFISLLLYELKYIGKNDLCVLLKNYKDNIE